MWWRANKPDEVGPAPGGVEERLSSLPIFAAAETAEIDHLAAGTELARYAAGRQVIREGRIPSHLFVALEGDLEVWSTGDSGGDPQLVNTMGAGDHFGEVGLLEGMPSTATVKTVTPCSLLRVSATAFLEVLARSPAVTAALIESVGGSMARSHPAYELAAETAAAHLTPGQVVSETAELMRSLEGDARRDLIRSLEAILDEAKEGS